jgi:uncharacterized protein Veg
MLLTVQNLQEIKEWIGSLVGREAIVEVNKGRKKTVVRKGVIEGIYPFFFVLRVDVDGTAQRMAFNYVDILTKTVELEIL